MSVYIRFQTSVPCPSTRRSLGVFRAAGLLNVQDEIDDCFQSVIEESLGWFNQHLVAPRVARKYRRCVFWFRTESQAMIRQLWTLIAILRDQGIQVSLIRAADPGLIVYCDDYQVAAVPNRRTAADLRI